MQSCDYTFIQLIRLGIGHTADDLSGSYDWQTIQTLATKHGLTAIVIDGIRNMPEASRPPKRVLLEWLGKVVKTYELRYKLYRNAIEKLASFYNNNGLKMMVLKGYACSLDWPKPEHRPCGDIDIWLFGEYKKADSILAKKKGKKIDKSEHHHTAFKWRSFRVENHFDFVNVHAYRSNAAIEKIFKELGKDDSFFVEVNGERVYLPSPNLHALFLLRHMISHFAAAEINIRQVLDWAFFVEKHTKEVDWCWLLELLDKYHMRDFFNCINAICVENLGFDSAIFPEAQFLPETKQRVLKDILNPAYGNTELKKLIPRLLYKIKRRKENAWKQKLCYDESLWSGFWSGVWNHLLKPSSI